LNKDLRPGLTVLFFSLAGIILAFIEYVLNENSIIIDDFVSTTVTLPDLMSITIIIWVLIGIIVGVAASR
jgi:hypothetical protein